MSRTLILSVLSAVMVAIGGYAYINASQSVGQTQAQPLMAASAQEAGVSEAATGSDATAADSGTDPADAEQPPVVAEMAMGQADAPITVIEYGSLTCPHCARFHSDVYPQLVENYVDTGLIRFIFREVYFDRYGLWAGMVARCGGEMRYFGIVEMMYDEQRDWVQGEPAEVAQNLRRIGRRAGLSDEQLDSCMTDNAMAQAMVTLSTEQVNADEVQGTPSFVINGTLNTNMSYADFSELLDGMLADIEG